MFSQQQLDEDQQQYLLQQQAILNNQIEPLPPSAQETTDQDFKIPLPQAPQRERSRENLKKSKICITYYQGCNDCLRSKNGRKCVCTIKIGSRKAFINQGCKQCGCIECGQDYDFNQNQSFHHAEKQQNKSFHHAEKYQNQRMCCQQCDKKTSFQGKTCICQIPSKFRTVPLPKNGCKNCGCLGFFFLKRCSKQDLKADLLMVDSQLEEKHNFYNLRKNPLIIQINNQLGVFPPMVGVGVPERTYTYIMGKPKNI